MSTWRQDCEGIIANVIYHEGMRDRKKLRKALKEAYPFGERANHPYKVWLSEVKRQLGGSINKTKPRDVRTLDLFKEQKNEH